MKKNLLCMLLAGALCLALFACDSTVEETTTQSESQAPTNEATSEIATQETEALSETESQSAPSDTQDSEVETEAESATVIETVTETETKTETDTEAETETETKDPRLSMEYAPVLYLDAKEIYDLTADGVYEERPSKFKGYDEVTLLTDENGQKSVKLLAYNDYQDAGEAYITLFSQKTDVAPWYVVKYRTLTPSITMEVYTDSVNQTLNAGSRAFTSVYSDGEWHLATINLQSKINGYDGKTANYFRFDFMNKAILPVDSYLEIAYIGFFASEKDAQLFEYGEPEEIIYIDPSSGYTESKLIHNTYLDMINGKGEGGASTYSSRGGNSTDGIETFVFNGETFGEGKLVLSGWTIVDGGVEKYVWSADGGKTWHDMELHKVSSLGTLDNPHVNATLSETGAEKLNDPENAKKGGGYQGEAKAQKPIDRARGIAADLSEYAGKTVNVTVAAVPRAEKNTLSLIAYITGVTVVEEMETETEEVLDPNVDPDQCTSHKESQKWYHVEGEAKESKRCLNCGAIIEATLRNTHFVVCSDSIEYDGGKRGWKKTHAGDQPYVVDDVASMPATDLGLKIQGWAAVNGGISAYKWSLDGENWFDVDTSSSYGSGGSAHVSAINGYNYGLEDFSSKLQFTVSMSKLNDMAAGTYTVMIGVVPADNQDITLHILTVKNVVVK